MTNRPGIVMKQLIRCGIPRSGVTRNDLRLAVSPLVMNWVMTAG
jgi:hypothetical protein